MNITPIAAVNTATSFIQHSYSTSAKPPAVDQTNPSGMATNSPQTLGAHQAGCSCPLCTGQLNRSTPTDINQTDRTHTQQQSVSQSAHGQGCACPLCTGTLGTSKPLSFDIPKGSAGPLRLPALNSPILYQSPLKDVLPNPPPSPGPQPLPDTGALPKRPSTVPMPLTGDPIADKSTQRNTRAPLTESSTVAHSNSQGKTETVSPKMFTMSQPPQGGERLKGASSPVATQPNVPQGKEAQVVATVAKEAPQQLPQVVATVAKEAPQQLPQVVATVAKAATPQPPQGGESLKGASSPVVTQPLVPQGKLEQVIATVAKEAPQQLPQVVATVVKEAPQQLSQVVATVAKEAPQQLSQVVATVAKEAPQQLPQVVATVAKEAPQQLSQTLSQVLASVTPMSSPATVKTLLTIIQTLVESSPKSLESVVKAIVKVATQAPKSLSVMATVLQDASIGSPVSTGPIATSLATVATQAPAELPQVAQQVSQAIQETPTQSAPIAVALAIVAKAAPEAGPRVAVALAAATDVMPASTPAIARAIATVAQASPNELTQTIKTVQQAATQGQSGGAPTSALVSGHSRVAQVIQVTAQTAPHHMPAMVQVLAKTPIWALPANPMTLLEKLDLPKTMPKIGPQTVANSSKEAASFGNFRAERTMNMATLNPNGEMQGFRGRSPESIAAAQLIAAKEVADALDKEKRLRNRGKEAEKEATLRQILGQYQQAERFEDDGEKGLAALARYRAKHLETQKG